MFIRKSKLSEIEITLEAHRILLQSLSADYLQVREEIGAFRLAISDSELRCKLSEASIDALEASIDRLQKLEGKEQP